jgi:hypothetical protein
MAGKLFHGPNFYSTEMAGKPSCKQSICQFLGGENIMKKVKIYYIYIKKKVRSRE